MYAREDALDEAKTKNDFTIVLKYFKIDGTDINAVNDNGWTALHFAAYHNDYNLTRYLLDQKNIDVSKKSNSGMTPLQMTRDGFIISLFIREGADELKAVLQALDFKGDDVNEVKKFTAYGRQTPLFMACVSTGYFEVIKYLHGKGAKEEGNILHRLVEHKKLNINNAAELIKLYDLDINKKISYNYEEMEQKINPLQYAVFKNYVWQASVLLELGADVNVKFKDENDETEWTLLEEIQLRNDIKEMESLLKKYIGDSNKRVRTEREARSHFRSGWPHRVRMTSQ